MQPTLFTAAYSASRAIEASRSAAPIVGEVRTDGDTTVALIFSGSAPRIATGATALSGHDHRRLSKVA